MKPMTEKLVEMLKMGSHRQKRGYVCNEVSCMGVLCCECPINRRNLQQLIAELEACEYCDQVGTRKMSCERNHIPDAAKKVRADMPDDKQ